MRNVNFHCRSTSRDQRSDSTTCLCSPLAAVLAIVELTEFDIADGVDWPRGSVFRPFDFNLSACMSDYQER